MHLNFMKKSPGNIVFKSYFKILECCVISESPIQRSELAIASGISEFSNQLKKLQDSGLIKNVDGNADVFQITPEGMSSYLSLLAQMRADKHSKTATYIAILSLLVAIVVMFLSIK